MDADRGEPRGSAEILEEIEATRDRIDDILEDLGDRVSPTRALGVVARRIERTADRSPIALVVGACLLGTVLGRMVAPGRRRRDDGRYAP